MPGFAVLLLGILAYVVYRWRGRPGAEIFHLLAAALGWFVVAISVLIAAMLVVLAFGSAPLAGKAAMLTFVAAGCLGWQMRRRAVERSPERVARIDRVAFVGVYAVYAGAAVTWLVLGLVPALAAAFPSLGDQLREWGEQDTLFGDMALRAAGAARNSSSGVQVTLDYAFSALNIALATFLVVKVRGNRTANLLAIGMVGTAVAFNLQSHAALVVLGTQLGGFTQVWHDLGVHVLAGIAYVFALLLFPDGSIDRSRGPHLMGLALFFGLFSFIAISDHTSALVLLFGVLVPAAALLAHSRRFREAQSPELRQLYRLLGVAMGVSLVGAVAVLGVTSALNSRDERFTETTRDYEIQALAAGSYIFYCDPHTADMWGTVTVSEPTSSDEGTRIVAIEAHGSRFDKDHFELVADQTSVIRFTNTDGTEHNVSIYPTREQRDALFTGELFTGQDLATFTFRVFRIVFAIIPIALFVAILRYHLWDVDRLVNRAMVYGALTGVLGLLYAVGALVVGLVPGRFFDQSELVVVWILAAALLFRPVRRRLQAEIDRRFYREKLDTAHTLEIFSAHVRDQIDLDELAEELVSVVSDTMHPTQVQLWIRDAEGTPRRETMTIGGPR
jgi:plastocyanin